MIHRVLVYHISFNWSLVSVCQHVLCSICSMLYLPLLWSHWQPQCSLRPWLLSPPFGLMGSRPIIEKFAV